MKHLFFVLIWFSVNECPAFAQGPYCPGFACTATDVTLTEARLVDGGGNFIPKIFCILGGDVPDLFLSLTFHASISRYEVNFKTDIYINNVFYDTLRLCLGDLLSNQNYTYQLEQIPWECNDSVSLKHSVISWQSMNNSGEVCMTCTTAGKCNRYTDFIVNKPLSCSLNVTELLGDQYGTLPRALYCASPGDTIVFDNDLAGDTVTVSSSIIIGSSNNPIVLESTLNPVVSIQNFSSGSYRLVFDIASNGNLELRNLNIIGGFAGTNYDNHLIFAIVNNGILKLHQTSIFQNDAIQNPGILLMNRNNGQTFFSGNVGLHSN